MKEQGTVYFICGFVGSGKTTYSKKIAETNSAYRISIDEWLIPLYGEHLERKEFDANLAKLHKLFKESAIQLLRIGVDVIFDFGFWKESGRQEFSKWADKHSLLYEIHYLDASYELCKTRAFDRNKSLKDQSFKMTEEMLLEFWTSFEVPTRVDCTIQVESTDSEQ